MIHPRLLSIALMVCFIFTLASCWDREELNQIAIIIGVALDAAPESSTEPMEVTAQVITPRTSDRVSDREQSGGRSFENISLTGQGPTQTATRMGLGVARNLFFGQTQLVVLGEDLTYEDVRRLMERPGIGFQTRRAARIVVSKGVPGKELLSARVVLSDTPTAGIISLLDQQIDTGFIPDIRLRDFLAALNSKTAAAIAPAFSLSAASPETGTRQDPQPTIESVGTAVFTNGTIAGFLSPTETRGFLWAQGAVPLSIINLRFPDFPPDQFIAIQIRRNFAKTKVVAREDRVWANIDIEVRADIAEYGILKDISDPGSFRMLNRQLSLFVKNEVENTIRKTQQELNADILNLAEQLRRQDNRSYQRLAPIWDQIYPNIEVTVSVRAVMRHRGTTIIPPGVM